jgi:GxxExxY protein
MAFVDPNYLLSELTADVIAGFYRTYDAFGFGFLESVYRRALSAELRLAGLGVEREVPFELVHLGEEVGRYRADLIIEKTLIVEVKTGRLLDPDAIPPTAELFERDRPALRPGFVFWTEAESQTSHP